MEEIQISVREIQRKSKMGLILLKHDYCSELYFFQHTYSSLQSSISVQDKK